MCFLQNCIATHECNGIDIIIALILNDINPLGKKRMDLVLELKVMLKPLVRSTYLDLYYSLSFQCLVAFLSCLEPLVLCF